MLKKNALGRDEDGRCGAANQTSFAQATQLFIHLLSHSICQTQQPPVKSSEPRAVQSSAGDPSTVPSLTHSSVHCTQCSEGYCLLGAWDRPVYEILSPLLREEHSLGLDHQQGLHVHTTRLRGQTAKGEGQTWAR